MLSLYTIHTVQFLDLTKRDNHKMIRNQRGNIMLSMMVIFSIVVSIGFYINDQIVQKRRSSISFYQKSKAAIENDNAIKIISALIEEKLQENNAITQSEMQTYLNDEIKKRISPTFEIKQFKLQYSGAVEYGPVVSGPFNGIDAEIRKMFITMTVGSTIDNSPNLKNSSISLETTLASVPVTEFTLFSTSNIFSAIGGQAIEYSGRIHANGSVSLAGSDQSLKVRGSVTSADRVIHPQLVFFNIAPWQTNVALAPAYLDSSLTPMKVSGSSGCADCDGTGVSWGAYAQQRWNGQIQDKYHKVVPLNFKTLETPVAQNESSRFVIEPVRPRENLARKEKLAYKADIRIVNGVWYLKNPENEDEWPGIAVWSDHPGSFTTWDDDGIERIQAVGQEDIQNRLNEKGPINNRWPAGTIPKKFSFYPYDNAAKTIIDFTSGSETASPMVSYGGLYRKSGSTATWLPGHYANSSLCNANETCVNGCNNLVTSVKDTITCKNNSTGVETLISHPLVNVLNATRSGFRVGFIQEAAFGKDAKSKMWPMNFDVSALQNALQCQSGDHPGELGCYFGSSRFMKRPFNGIIYIANTWDGQNRLTGIPQRAPYMQDDVESNSGLRAEGGGFLAFPGSTRDSRQPVPHVAAQGQLPFQLCSTSKAGEPFTTYQFVIPNCADYKNHKTIKSRINSVRLINFSTVSADVLPKGLTIATNLPIFTVGDVNSLANVSSATATPWLPILIAGDFYVPFSNSWNDSYARWDLKTGDSQISSLRNASLTTIHAATSPTIVYYNENWSGQSLNKIGPHINFAGSYRTVYWQERFFFYGPNTYYNPGVIYYKEDPHYRFRQNQPPGIPMLNLFTINTWLTKESSNE